MAQFDCRVITENGQMVEERFNADSKDDLIVMFRNRGYRPVSIKEEKENFGSIELGRKKLKLKSLVLFCRQMSTLLHSGVPMAKCFDIIGSQSDDKTLKKAMAQLNDDVLSGAVLSKAMEKQGPMFPEMLIKMVEVGEVTGELTLIMERMATQYESDSRIKRKVRGALTYPIVLIGVALAAVVFMLIAVVPGFVEVFNSLNTELPVLTRMLLDVSDFFVNRWYIVLLVVPIIVFGIIAILRTEKVRRWIDKMKLTLKLIRSPMQKVMCAQLARTLHTLISSSVAIVQALEYTNRNIKNTLVNDCLNKIIVGVQQGKGIAVQLAEYEIFPKLLVSMVSIGETSGNLEDMLSKTADYYDEELDAAISQLTSMLEPFMILIVGLLIGVIVVALYAPMFEAISAISGSM